VRTVLVQAARERQRKQHMLPMLLDWTGDFHPMETRICPVG